MPDAPPAAHADALARLLSDLLADCLVVIYEVDAGSTTIVARAAQGPGARSVIRRRQPLGHGVSGWVAANRRAIDDTDAGTRSEEMVPALGTADASCTSVPVATAAGELIVSVYGPRATAAERVSAVRSLSLYLASVAAPGVRPAKAVGPKEMAIAS